MKETKTVYKLKRLMILPLV